MAIDFLKPDSPFSRRAALQALGAGFGYMAFAGLASQASANEGATNQNALAPKASHHAARAKRVIFLCMNGGPSHVDTFDYKPELNKRGGQSSPVGRDRGGARLLGSPFKFSQRGSAGLWMSELWPQLGTMADELCVIRSMRTDLPNHAQAFTQLHTGSFQFVRPSVGAWTLYGLGTENANLPGFITVNPPSDNGGARNYGSAFLPAVCQGTRIGGNQIPGFFAAFLGKDEEPGPPMKNLSGGQPPELQRSQLDLIRELDRQKLARDAAQPEIEGAIASFELAFRMQDEVPKVLDFKSETPATLALYGIGPNLPTDRFGRQCLLARRLAEAGVRFIEITAPATWDHHFLLQQELTKSCQAVDLPLAGLLTDLKQRGLLDDTLVVWGGEFGRTPYGQSGQGRDHNNQGFSYWLAGGGTRRGHSHGATDDFGYEAVEKPVHIHDLHATILHLLGLDHTRLTFNYGGRDFRLTDVYGKVVREIVS